jgi:hypothetical protein
MPETGFSPPRGWFESASVSGSISLDVSRIWEVGMRRRLALRRSGMPSGLLDVLRRAHIVDLEFVQSTPSCPGGTRNDDESLEATRSSSIPQPSCARLTSYGASQSKKRHSHLLHEHADVVRGFEGEPVVAVGCADADELRFRRRQPSGVLQGVLVCSPLRLTRCVVQVE